MMSLYDELPPKSFMRKLLKGVSPDFCEQFLQMKNQYETCKIKEDKRLYKDKLSNLFWELYTIIATMINAELGSAKRLFLRYGLVDLRNLTPEDQKFILSQPIEPVNYESETIFYVDDWLQGIVDGKIKASFGDETEDSNDNKSLSFNDDKKEKYFSLLEVEQGRFDGFKQSRETIFGQLKNSLDIMMDDSLNTDIPYKGVPTQTQTKALDELVYFHKEIKKLNKEMKTSASTMVKAQQSIDEMKGTQDNSGTENFRELLTKTIKREVASIRQMVKMTVGRQGNNTPFLTSSFLPRDTKDYFFRKTVKTKIDHWLSFDPEVFLRTYRGEQMNIMPYIILVPGYGTTGICWEPLDSNNKKFGRGRISLPIFTKTPDFSLLTAMGDLRWQVAKEVASYYWMEEGITGRYYGYYLEAKLKGDLKTLFINDYLLWMIKETQGVQKLEQDARYVFWRFVPLPDEKKIELSKKGYYYNQLWEKEQVWRKSDNK